MTEPTLTKKEIDEAVRAHAGRMLSHAQFALKQAAEEITHDGRRGGMVAINRAKEALAECERLFGVLNAKGTSR